MGVPRLTQDLSGYTEVAFLGVEADARYGEVYVSKIVIDGPSLVYHVYDGLLRTMSSAAIASAAVPTYSDVIDGVKSCLNALKSLGVTIEAVLFDGHLPTSKRGVRLERMENLRKQLEDFRKLHPQLQSFDDDISVRARNPWDAHSRPVSNARHALPPSPFLVPAILDAAKLSADIPNVSVVPEEADLACARLAKASGAAILTNDSDLVLYDLDPDGCVLVLRTLASTDAIRARTSKSSDAHDLDTKGSDRRLLVSCLHPDRIAQRLSLPSLLSLGFERSLDSSVSFSTIIQRAKESSMDEEKSLKLDEFQKQFLIQERPAISPLPNSLDPRISEFVTQAQSSSDSLHVYLPILHEDPSRDSSWTYGLVYRQLAYSICCCSFGHRESKLVIEHARKGSRIIASSVSMLDDIGITAMVEGMLEDLEGLAERLSSGRPNETSSPYFEYVSEWYAAALCIVLQAKLANSKTPLSHRSTDRLFGVEDGGQPKSSSRPMWEDMHLLANAQALLYSWRMLKQILDWTRQHPSTAGEYGSKSTSKGIERLRVWLEKMPALSELFLDLRRIRTCGSAEDRANAAAVVKRLVDIQIGTQVRSHAREEAYDIEDENGRRRKHPKLASKPKRIEHSSARNPFSALADDEEDEQDDDDDE